jgi:hypothetical protein
MSSSTKGLTTILGTAALLTLGGLYALREYAKHYKSLENQKPSQSQNNYNRSNNIENSIQNNETQMETINESDSENNH